MAFPEDPFDALTDEPISTLKPAVPDFYCTWNEFEAALDLAVANAPSGSSKYGAMIPIVNGYNLRGADTEISKGQYEQIEELCNRGTSLPVAEVTEGADEVLDGQVGGAHYKKHGHMQPWHVIDEYDLGYYAGTVLEYLLRYKDKGGVDDLKKARHTLSKLIQTLEE